MEYSEVYKGVSIKITTVQQPDGKWASSAEVLLSDDDRMTFQDADSQAKGRPRTHQLEKDAKRSALELAIEGIDRRRIQKGKP